MKRYLSRVILLVHALIFSSITIFIAEQKAEGEPVASAAQEVHENDQLQIDVNNLTEDQIKALLGNNEASNRSGNCQSSACQEGSACAQEDCSQGHI